MFRFQQFLGSLPLDKVVDNVARMSLKLMQEKKSREYGELTEDPMVSGHPQI